KTCLRPHAIPTPRAKANQVVDQEEDYAEDDKRGFEQHFAGGVVHLESPIFQRRQSSPSFFGFATQPSRTCSAPDRGTLPWGDPVVARKRAAHPKIAHCQVAGMRREIELGSLSSKHDCVAGKTLARPSGIASATRRPTAGRTQQGACGAL